MLTALVGTTISNDKNAVIGKAVALFHMEIFFIATQGKHVEEELRKQRLKQWFPQ